MPHLRLVRPLLIISVGLSGLVAACTVTHRVEAPSEPIRIELAVKIAQEVRVRLDKDVAELIENNPDLF